MKALTNKGKAKIIDAYHKKLGIKLKTTENFGVMLNILCGKL